MITRQALRRRMADLRGWLRMLAVVESEVGRKVARTGARVALERLRTATGPGVRLKADIPYRTHDHNGNPRAVSIDGALQLMSAAESVMAE